MIVHKYRECLRRWLMASAGKNMTLCLLLFGQGCCAWLIWFYHNPGFQFWVALPVMGALATIGLLAGSGD